MQRKVRFYSSTAPLSPEAKALLAEKAAYWKHHPRVLESAAQ